MIDENAIGDRYEAIKGKLDERGRRLFAAAENAAAGYGGTAAVFRATGVARSTIIRGAKALMAPCAAPAKGRIGRPRRRSAADQPNRPDSVGRAPPAGGTGNDGQSAAAAAVGVEEPRDAGRRPARDEPRDQR